MFPLVIGFFAIREKELLWIDWTTKRWDGYLRFAREPGPMLAWFERHMVEPRGSSYEERPS